MKLSRKPLLYCELLVGPKNFVMFYFSLLLSKWTAEKGIFILMASHIFLFIYLFIYLFLN